MSWRRGLRHCLPSGFPGSCRLFTILEAQTGYTPLVPPGMVAIASLVLDAVYNIGLDDAPRRRKASVKFRALKGLAYRERQLATSSPTEWRIRTDFRLRMMMPRLFVQAFQFQYTLLESPKQILENLTIITLFNKGIVLNIYCIINYLLSFRKLGVLLHFGIISRILGS